MQLKRDPFYKQRLGMLGNAVVLAAACAAFANANANASVVG